MERLGVLITKLKDQFDEKIEADKLLLTTQLILAELQQHQSQPTLYGNISVVMPINNTTEMQTQTNSFMEPEQPKIHPQKKEENVGWLFDPLLTVPTLAHQNPQIKTEVNDAIEHKKESVNDKLKEEKIEVAAALLATPVRDLKKAIGINDRYLFITELFRGDENMFERSIKTINNFSIYPEAEYWIQRELKVKLGWNELLESVKLFDQLVRRRFS